MKKIGIIFLIVFIIIILIFLINKNSNKSNIDNKNITNSITEKNKANFEEDGDVYTVTVDNEVKYLGTDAIQAEIYSEDLEFDLQMPNFDEN